MPARPPSLRRPLSARPRRPSLRPPSRRPPSGRLAVAVWLVLLAPAAAQQPAEPAAAAPPPAATSSSAPAGARPPEARATDRGTSGQKAAEQQGQTAPAEEPPPGETTAEGEQPPAAAAAPAESGEMPTDPVTGEPAPSPEAGDLPRTQREGFLPRLDVLFPEGELDLRVSRLVDKVFFQGQVKYNFVDGDITAFMRYRYYGFQRTYQLTAFDALEFKSLEQLSNEFERTRGFLVLTQWPHDYHHRTYLLGELDRITSNKEALQFDNNKTNTFVRLGYQIGTPNDPRSNAIVGESRAEVERLFTAFRDIGPGDFGLTTAATYGFDWTGGSFDYVKLEAEGLKRFELTRGRPFLVGRLHAGSFLYKDSRPEATDREPADRYTIPRMELFHLDGNDNLKGLGDPVRGTEQLYTTWEYFFPWFVEQERRALWLDWQTWYWILYAGYGTTGFERSVYGDFDSYVPDVGIGFESSFRLKKYTFFLSGIVAQAQKGDGGVEAKLSIKSYR